MPTILPEGVPWWAWAIIAMAVVVATPLSGVATAWINRGLKKDMRKVVHQTENEHGNSEYPNMRDELTVVRQGIEALIEGQKRHDTEIASIRTDSSHTRGDVAALRGEHSETRAWVQAEASERRAITRSVEQVKGALSTHIEFAIKRDEQIAELQQTIEKHHPPQE